MNLSLSSALAGRAVPVLWARKKKRKSTPAPRPPEKKKARRKPAAPAARRPQKNDRGNWALRLEKGIGGWYDGAGFSNYTPRQWAQMAILFAALGVVISFFSFSAGGYFVVRRGWGELVLLYLLVLGLLFGLPLAGRMSRLGAAELGLFGAYSLLILGSVKWSWVPANSFAEFLRAALYLAGFVVFYLFLARRRWLGWLGHLFVAIAFVVALAALKAKILPDAQEPVFDLRLSWPLTYWNALALMMVMAFPIGLSAIAQKGAALTLRMLYGVALFTLLVVLFFTVSRGGMIFLALALAIYLVFAVHRLRALLQAGMAIFWTAVVVASCYIYLPAMKAICYQSKSCPDGPSLGLQSSQGHELGILLLILFAAAIGSQALVWWLEGKVWISAALGRKIGTGLVVAGAVAVLGVGSFVVVKKGGPVTFVRNQVDTLFSTQRAQTVVDPGQRLLSDQSERPQEYKISLETMAAHPLTGTGANTWQISWLKNRPYLMSVKNGHSLFFDSLAELGIIGGGLLVAFVVIFFVNSIRDLRFLGRSRHRELYGAFFAASAVLVLHSFMDWDWQMPVVFLPFMFFAGALLRYGMICRQEEAGNDPPAVASAGRAGYGRLRRLLRWNWLAGFGCVVIMAAVVFPMLAESRVEKDGDIIQAYDNLANQHDDSAAQAELRDLESNAARAHFFNPLASQPLQDEATADEHQGLYLNKTGKAQAAGQKMAGAQQLWNQALDVDPYNYQILVAMGWFYLDINQVDKAAQAARKARHLDPQDEPDQTPGSPGVIANLEVAVRKAGGRAALGY